MKKTSMWRRDFTMVVIGQIISLFGNAILRFALPLYLLNETGSATLFGVVMACSFIPMIVLSPVGGIVADRVNKRNVMVALDFSTAGLMALFTLLLGHMNLVVLLVITLMLLFGIQGAYQPSVQASLPSLVTADQLLPANAVINQVSALANLIGPVAGGALFAVWGLMPILLISIACFLFPAVMEIFIHIPFEKRKSELGVFAIVKQDLHQSFTFIRRQQPVIGKILAIVAAFNLFLSALMIISIPVLIKQTLSLPADLSDQLYGYAQGALALGGLAGGCLAGLFAKKLRVQKASLLLLGSAMCLVPMGAVLLMQAPAMVSYLVITLCSFVMMALATMFSVMMLAYVQAITPMEIIGKVISCAITFSMCAQPVGQALYGWLFDALPGQHYWILFGGALVSCVIAGFSKAAFGKLLDVPENEPEQPLPKARPRLQEESI